MGWSWICSVGMRMWAWSLSGWKAWIRTALGAAPNVILRLMLRDSAGTVAVGTMVGILAAAFSTRLARALLFALALNDPTTFVVALVVILAVSLVAAFVPAYRAAETDPLSALHHE
jgi:ABC-type antimicrobial peptide transport system permease subunit